MYNSSKSRKTWFKNMLTWTGGFLSVLLSVYLQGWMKYTASQNTLPSDLKLLCCTELILLYKTLQAAPVRGLTGRGARRVMLVERLSILSAKLSVLPTCPDDPATRAPCRRAAEIAWCLGPSWGTLCAGRSRN